MDSTLTTYGWTVLSDTDGTLELRAPLKRKGLARKSQSGRVWLVGGFGCLALGTFAWRAVLEHHFQLNALIVGGAFLAYAVVDRNTLLRILVTSQGVDVIREAFGRKLGSEHWTGTAVANPIGKTGAFELRFDTNPTTGAIYIGGEAEVNALAALINRTSAGLGTGESGSPAQV